MVSSFSKFNPLQALRNALHDNDADRDKTDLQSFNIRREKEEAYESIKRGTSMVPLKKIVGSVGRYQDFDNQFKTKSAKIDERLASILTAMKAGKAMPPISLYQIKDDFFILDGHHRFQAAKILRHTDIRSHILELLPSKNTLENMLYREKTEFRDKAGLTHRIDLTELGQFDHLDKQISDHQKFLMREGDLKEINYGDAARDWYTTIYQPLAVEHIVRHLVR